MSLQTLNVHVSLEDGIISNNIEEWWSEESLRRTHPTRCKSPDKVYADVDTKKLSAIAKEREIVRLFLEGYSDKDIAETVGMYIKDVVATRVFHGHKRRNNNGKKLSAEKIRKIEKLYAKGMSFSAIAREVGCSATSAYCHAKKVKR